ncbi:hypothetical protein HED52_06290 [Ochrobactrum ciceri]|uniref:Uncharacterized protein n=1 Tax=Brucella ciceri TaxID=391287 RepID=A0ABX1DSV6_9HYPH|nr:hypothetical protein [Brucella ciceri]
MGIPQMEERNIDGMIFGHWTFLGVSSSSMRRLRSSSAPEDRFDCSQHG